MQWNLQYEKLVEFKRKNGHCIVPHKYEQDKSFGREDHKQRFDHTNNIADRPDRKKLLVELGFVWKVDPIVARAPIVAARAPGKERKWHEHYEKLVEFKQINGHSIVPKEYERDKVFGRWVHTQRRNHANNKMRPDRKDLLDEIGFVWKVDPSAARAAGEDMKWYQQYKKLVEFRQKNGHCLVSRREDERGSKVMSLGRWVNRQRCNHTKNIMRPGRKKLLVDIGFVWKVDRIAVRPSGEDMIWYQQYEKLVEFRQKNGHCIVPKEYGRDQAFGRWVNTQRCNHTKNIMRPDRKDLLDELGFAWKPSTLAARRSPTTDDDSDSDSDSDSEAVTINGVGIPNEAIEETEPALLGRVRKRIECASPANTKRRRIYLAESGQIIAATRTNREGNAASGSCCSVETDAGHDAEELEPSLVPSRVLICSDQDDYVVQEEQATLDGIPAGWIRTKLEPDW